MLRVIVSVLAAFVGFSFGHSIPKWMESRQKSATGMQSPSLSEHAPRTRKQSFRKKSLRKFKFGLQKPGKDNVEGNGSLHKLCDDAEVTSHEDVQSKELHMKLKFRAQRLPTDKSTHVCLNQGLDSSAKRPLCAFQFDSLCRLSKQNGFHDQQAAPTDPNISRHGLSEVSSSQLNAACIAPQEVQVLEALQKDSNPVPCKSSSLQSPRGSPTKEKSQMKQWKMKLTSLRSKAMASEKVWYEKFDNEGCGGKLSVSPTGPVMAMKETAKGKENESPHVMRTKKRDFFWCRSSSRVGLLVEVEGHKSAVER